MIYTEVYSRSVFQTSHYHDYLTSITKCVIACWKSEEIHVVTRLKAGKFTFTYTYFLFSVVSCTLLTVHSIEVVSKDNVFMITL